MHQAPPLEEQAAAVMSQIRVAGDRLVDVLRDQVADGQAETLYSLQTAAAAIRRHSQQVSEATAALVVAAEGAAAAAADEVAAAAVAVAVAAEQAARQLAEHTSSATGAAARQVSEATVSLAGAAYAAAGQVGDATADLCAVADATAQRIVDAAAALAEDFDATARQVTDDAAVRLGAVAEVLGTGTAEAVEAMRADLRWQLGGDIEALAQRLSAAVTDSTQALRDDAAESSQQVLTQLGLTTSTLTAIAEAAAVRTEDARTALEWAAEVTVQRLDAVSSVLETQAAISDTALRSTGAALAEQIRLAGIEAATRLEAAASFAITAVDEAALDAEQRMIRSRQESADSAAEALHSMAEAARALVEDAEQRAASLAEDSEAFLGSLRARLRAQEKRDAAATARGRQQIHELAGRVEAGLAAAIDALGAQTRRLEARDEQLESRRADEFVRVLEDVLSRGGVKGRGLLDRVRRGIAASPPAGSEEPADPSGDVLPDLIEPEPTVTEPAPKRATRARVRPTAPAATPDAPAQAARPRRTPRKSPTSREDEA
ncbi:MAG: hypothetical protein Q8R60_11125 [Mycobacteriales bacterium]|nr:hypothetical protein [Mycobacteriales bacterium]